MLDIKPLQKNELPLLLTAINQENWEIQSIHLESLFMVFANDFFIAKIDNQTIGFISALKYTNNFGFISNFIILKNFRSLGYGKELFTYAIHHLKGCQIALECKENQRAFYESFGFKHYYDSLIYVYDVRSIPIPHLQTTAHLDKEKFLEYHQSSLPQKYVQHLLNVVQDSKSNFQAIYNQAHLNAYGICFKYKDGYKVVLSSNTYEDGLTLFYKLIEDFDQGVKIYIEVTKLETNNLKLVERLKMQEYSRMSKMYNKIL